VIYARNIWNIARNIWNIRPEYLDTGNIGNTIYARNIENGMQQYTVFFDRICRPASDKTGIGSRYNTGRQVQDREEVYL